MSILSAQSLRLFRPLFPLRDAYRIELDGHTLSGGLGPAGYDIALAQDVNLGSGGFALASAVELFNMRDNIAARVHDKSTWARRGVTVQNTFIEPGWRGYLTLELTNHSPRMVHIPQGAPIAQVVFEWVDAPTELPYSGKYQDQEAGPQEAR